MRAERGARGGGGVAATSIFQMLPEASGAFGVKFLRRGAGGHESVKAGEERRLAPEEQRRLAATRRPTNRASGKAVYLLAIGDQTTVTGGRWREADEGWVARAAAVAGMAKRGSKICRAKYYNYST